MKQQHQHQEISIDAAVRAVVSELDGIFVLRQEQRNMAQKAFISGKDVFLLLLTPLARV